MNILYERFSTFILDIYTPKKRFEFILIFLIFSARMIYKTELSELNKKYKIGFFGCLKKRTSKSDISDTIKKGCKIGVFGVHKKELPT